MNKVNIGIIGCGKRILDICRQMPHIGKEIEIVALYDPRKEATDVFKKGIAPKAEIYSDYCSLVKDARISWILIGSWNCFHSEHAIAALGEGKHVFCEKPLATTLKDCLAIKYARDKAGLLFSVGFTLRYSPHYKTIRELILNGAIGNIISMEFNETLDFEHGGYIHGDWRRWQKYAGTHLLEKCCHDIDIVQWIVDALPRQVASFGGLNFFIPKNKKYIQKLGKAANGRDAFSFYQRAHDANPFTAKKDIVDNQVAILEFTNGVRASFHTNCSTNMPERRMYICGTEGTLRADVLKGVIEICKIGHKEKPSQIQSGGIGGHGGGDEILGQDLAESILYSKKPVASLEDGLLSAITCFGLNEACETNRIVDMGPYWKKAGIVEFEKAKISNIKIGKRR